MMQHIILRSLFLASAFYVSGCVSLLPETAPPKPRYHIEAVVMPAGQGDTVDWSLVIEDPHTTRAYDSVRIAVSPLPGKIEYYADAEWADRAPQLFQTALVQTFEDSGRILAVGERSAVPIGDIVLQTDIRALHFNVRGGGKNAEVSVYARLSDGKGRIYAVKRFDTLQPANSDRGDDVVAAFNGAFQSVIADIATWTFEEGAKVVDGR
jgi:cholesterol transport system auxiliary component